MAGPRLFPIPKTVVVKIGTSNLTRRGGGLNVRRIRDLASELRYAKGLVENVAVVTSGAIVSGMDVLGIRGSPHALPMDMKQACAAVGQPLLMTTYVEEFSNAGLRVAQILVTQEDFGDLVKYANLWRTLKALFNSGVIPVVNENDAIAVHELKPLNANVPSKLRFGDNDRLSAIVASKVGADLLVMLTDVDGMYVRSREGSRTLVRVSRGVPGSLLTSAEGSGPVGRGGMRSKLLAARLASAAGVAVVISNGFRRGALRRAIIGEPRGTTILPRTGERR